MPTGYTAGILDGTTKTFQDFAKLCSRAFMVHLRDEPMNSEYKEREPSDYHVKAIKKAECELKEANSISDEKIIAKERIRLTEDKKYHLENIKKDEANSAKMKEFLKQAQSYKPPTEKHNSIAKFMVEQLTKTIDFDCDSSYHSEQLKTIDDRIKNINADDIRSEMKIKATKDIAYHTKEYEEELKRCREHNKWYEDFINSLK